MSDLADRIRRTVDNVKPVTIDEVVITASRRRRRRNRALGAAGALAVAAVVAVGVVVVAGHHRSTTVTVGPASNAGGTLTSSATKNGITARVTLDANRAVAGKTIAGQLTVINNSGRALTAGFVCPGNFFAVGLSNRQFPPDIAFSGVGCRDPFTLPTGTTIRSFAVQTTYATVAGLLALPAGRYQASLIVDGLPIPTPPSISVTLSPGPGPTAAPPSAPTPPSSTNGPPPTVPPNTG
jgi:hypothetical protein